MNKMGRYRCKPNGPGFHGYVDSVPGLFCVAELVEKRGVRPEHQRPAPIREEPLTQGHHIVFFGPGTGAEGYVQPSSTQPRHRRSRAERSDLLEVQPSGPVTIESPLVASDASPCVGQIRLGVCRFPKKDPYGKPKTGPDSSGGLVVMLWVSRPEGVPNSTRRFGPWLATDAGAREPSRSLEAELDGPGPPEKT